MAEDIEQIEAEIAELHEKLHAAHARIEELKKKPEEPAAETKAETPVEEE
jgi:hypothetical protein